jgi:hypothetical protein
MCITLVIIQFHSKHARFLQHKKFCNPLYFRLPVDGSLAPKHVGVISNVRTACIRLRALAAECD